MEVKNTLGVFETQKTRMNASNIFCSRAPSHGTDIQVYLLGAGANWKKRYSFRQQKRTITKCLHKNENREKNTAISEK